jgi:hypothetical protein
VRPSKSIQGAVDAKLNRICAESVGNRNLGAGTVETQESRALTGCCPRCEVCRHLVAIFPRLSESGRLPLLFVPSQWSKVAGRYRLALVKASFCVVSLVALHRGRSWTVFERCVEDAQTGGSQQGERTRASLPPWISLSWLFSSFAILIFSKLCSCPQDSLRGRVGSDRRFLSCPAAPPASATHCNFCNLFVPIAFFIRFYPPPRRLRSSIDFCWIAAVPKNT